MSSKSVERWRRVVGFLLVFNPDAALRNNRESTVFTGIEAEENDEIRDRPNIVFYAIQ
jgi:hypothetical protein